MADLGVSSGVAAYVNESLNIERIETPELSLDGHFQLFRIGGIMVGNAYVPYSNYAIPEAADLRRRWDEKLYEKIREMALGEHLIVCGDFNVVHEESDSFDSKIVKKVPCFMDWERANFDRLIKDLPLTDTFRYLNPDLRKYSYFFRKEHRIQNAGWRIDYALCSQALLPFVRRSDIIENFGSSKSLPLLIDIQFKHKNQ